MDDATKKVFEVPAENISKLQDQIADLNKKVARLAKRGYAGIEPVVIQVGEMYVVEGGVSETGGEKKPDRVYAQVTLVSPKPPKVDGWEFIAALTHIEDVGAVLRVCPGAEVSEGELKRYREASSENCDHCQAKRRRSDTFVIRSVSGELKQVGRQCLQSFTGLKNPEHLCAMAEILFSAADMLGGAEDEGWGNGGSEARYSSIRAYLPFVACSIRQDGWLSRGVAREQGREGQSTCDLALSLGLWAKPTTKGRLEPSEKDYGLASATVEFCQDYFEGCDVGELSDYENSLRVAMSAGILHPKLAGIVASAIQFYNKDVERRARNEVWAKMVASSEFQGTVGERQTFEDLKVVGYRTWESQFGVTHFYTFVSAAGHCLTYFASRDMDLSIGQVISLSASVKKHEVYTPKSGAPAYKQTTITRATLVTRATVRSADVVEHEERKQVAPASLPGQPFEFSKYAQVKVPYNHYHFEAQDGRRFVLVSKSKKKALKVGVEMLVQYAVEDLSQYNGGERPVSLVK